MNNKTPNPETKPHTANDRRAEDFQLATYFPYLVRTYYRAVSQSVRNVYTDDFGLNVNEWRTMAVLNDFEPLSAKEIVARSSMDKVNVSRAISGLQKSGLLERHVDPTDRRRVLLRLTRQGKQIMRELIPHILDIEQNLLAGLSEGEQDTLKALMKKVSDNANALTATQARTSRKQRAQA